MINNADNSVTIIIMRDAMRSPSLSFARPSKSSRVSIWLIIYLGQALQAKGRLPEAIAEYRGATELDDDPFALALLGQAYARSGQRDEATKILARLNEQAKSRYVAAYGIAVLYLGLGDKKRAMDELERAYRENDGNDIYNIRVDPLLDDLRGDPRFEALAERIVPAKEFGAARK